MVSLRKNPEVTGAYFSTGSDDLRRSSIETRFMLASLVQKLTPKSTDAESDLPPIGISADELVLALADEIAPHLGELETALVGIIRGNKVSMTGIQQLLRKVILVRRTMKSAQQTGRVLAGRLRQTMEDIRLNEALEDVVKSRRLVFSEAGIKVDLKLKAVDVQADSGLTVGLLDAAMDWAAERGNQIGVTLSVKNWPRYGVLQITSRPAVAERNKTDAVADDTVSWFLLKSTALAMGVILERTYTSQGHTVTMEFTRTVTNVEGLSLVEIDAPHDSPVSGGGSQIAGYRLLLLCSDPKVIFAVEQQVRRMGLVLDTVADSRKATQFCEMEVPHLLIVDERDKDPQFAELRGDLLRSNPSFPFVEIAQGNSVFEMSGWMEDSYSRVSQDTIRTQLVHVLTFELARVM